MIGMKQVRAVFFSPTGKTMQITCEIADHIAKKSGITWAEYDFTLPSSRKNPVIFSADDLVIFGVPVYAGRVPNKILPEIQRMFSGNNALAVPVVTFGNRSYDNALVELRNELEGRGFHTIAGGAFVAEHAFSDKLGGNRPDKKDMEMIDSFAESVVQKIQNMKEIPDPVKVKGIEPIPAYYQPLKENGKPAVFLKAKPKINENCIWCKKCAEACPMDSIRIAEDRGDWHVDGICIKCQACVKKCPQNAVYFDDAAFLSHVKMLEENYVRRAENEVFY